MKQQMLIDIDGVIADIYPHLIEFEYRETGERKKTELLSGKKTTDVFPNYEKHLQEANFFRTIPPILNSIERVKFLNSKYDIFLISDTIKYPNSLRERYDWINEFFPFIMPEQLVFYGNINIIKGDILIDDNPKNLDAFSGKKILFTQPHNVLLVNNNYLRMNNWNDALKLL